MRRFIAAGFGVGLLPRRLWGSDNGAGTLGAAVAALVGLALIGAPWWADLMVAGTAVVVSLWAAAPFAGDHADPGWVTIDEVAGTLTALIGLQGWPWLVALAVARLADIFKVLPGVQGAEALPGAIGVTADDVVAGFYGLAVGLVMMQFM